MKTRILLAASLALAPLASSARAQSTFPDVPDNHWAAKAVQKLAEAGIIEGFPATRERAAAPRPVAAAPQSKSQPTAKVAATAASKSAARAKIAARRAPQTAAAQAKVPARRISSRAAARPVR